MQIQEFTSKILPLKNKLYRFAWYYLKDKEEAADVIQEVMIKVWHRRENWHMYKSLEAWCMTITRNMCLDKLRANKHQTQDVESVMYILGHNDSPDKEVQGNETFALIRRLLDMLPDKQKEAVVLRDIEGYSYEEIADIMQIELSSVKINIHRGRKFLKEHLININAYGL